MRGPPAPAVPRRALALLLAALLMLPGPSVAIEAYNEPAVKAAFLYRFTGYVEWPQAALAKGRFTVAVLADADVARELRTVLAQRQVKGLPSEVREVARAADLGDAQLVYIGPRYAGSVGQVAAQLARKPVLVVTDSPSGLDDGGTVNFLTVDRRVRFEVSLPAAERAELRVSSALLSVAARVRGGPLGRSDACDNCGRLFAGSP